MKRKLFYALVIVVLLLAFSALAAASETALAPQAEATLRDMLIAQQSSRTFDLTLNQTYCDGKKLYYAYSLKTNQNSLVFGEGQPSGFDSWDMESPGMTFAETWWIEPQETYQQMCDWFAGGGSRYVIRDSVAIGDGANIADGSEKGPVNYHLRQRRGMDGQSDAVRLSGG